MNLTYTERSCDRPQLSAQPTVYVVDGDLSVRESLDVKIRAAGWQPRMAASAEEFLQYPRLVSPACLVAELNLPGLTGLDLQKLVLGRRELPIIFTSDRADVRAAVEAMKGGAFELLTKPLTAEVLVSTIRHALERSRAALDYVAHIEALKARYGLLSPREREVMGHVVSGRLNKQVSFDLGITEFTVKVHRGRIMRKMRAASLAELVTMVDRLHRWMGAMTGNVSLPAEPLTDPFVLLQSEQSDRPRTSRAVPA